MIKDIGFILYAVTDLERSKKFYGEVLGLKQSADFADSGYWAEYAVGATNTFSIGCSPDYLPSKEGASVAFEVDNFDEYIQSLKDKGVIFNLEPQDFPTCRMAVINDPDENKVIIHQLKTK